MKNVWPWATFLLLAPFASCKKETISRPPSEPFLPATATLKRTYLVSGAVRHDTTYGLRDSVRATAHFRSGKLFLDLYSNQSVRGYSDGVVFSMDSLQLLPGIKGGYSLTAGGSAAYFNTVYAIQYTFENNGREFRTAATEFGYDFSGNLNITAYDSVTRALSGTFQMRITGLGHVAGAPYPVLTSAPADVELEGSFNSVKISR